MSNLLPRAGLLALVALVCACGGPHASRDAGAGAATPGPDGGDAAGPDAPSVAPDAAPDTAPDALADVRADAPPDATASAEADARAEVAPRVPARALNVAMGDDFACVLEDDHTVTCWGKAAPVVKLGAGPLVRTLAAGGSSACAILDDGAVKCWGARAGAGTFVATLPAGAVAIDLVVGRHWACVALADRTVHCWNDQWIFGVTLSTRSFPFPEDAGLLEHLAFDYGDEIAALWQDGRISQPLPFTLVAPILFQGKPATSIYGCRGGIWAWCIARSTGGVDCTSFPGNSRPDSATVFTQIVLGESYFCGLHDNGIVTCWGRLAGCDDLVSGGSYWCKAPERADHGRDVALGQPAVAIAEASDFTGMACAVLQDGSVKCWGGAAATCLPADGGVQRCEPPVEQHPVIGDSVTVETTSTGRAYGAWRAIDLDAPP